MKKFTSWAKKLFTYLILLGSITIFITALSKTISLQEVNFQLFNYKSFIVVSDSMKATDFRAGDLIIVKKTDPNHLKVGDIITFKSRTNDPYNKVITHKIRKIDKNSKNTLYTTYGTSTNTDDQDLVLDEDIIGKYVFKVSKLGYLLNFLKSYIGLVILTIIVLTSLIIYLIIKLVKILKKERGEL